MNKKTTLVFNKISTSTLHYRRFSNDSPKKAVNHSVIIYFEEPLTLGFSVLEERKFRIAKKIPFPDKYYDFSRFCAIESPTARGVEFEK